MKSLQKSSQALRTLDKELLEKCKQNLKKVSEITHVFEYQTPSLAKIKKDFSESFMLNYLRLWLMDLNSFIAGDSSSKMSDENIDIAIKMIYQDYYFLNMADLKLIGKRLKVRKFIRVTGNEIYQEITSYFNERCEQAQAISESESNSHKSLEVKKGEGKSEGIIYDEYKKIADSKNIEKLLSIKSEQEKQKEAMKYYHANKARLKKESDKWNEELEKEN